MFIFDISFNIGIYKCVPSASCSATLYPELPVIVWFTLNRIFTHSSSKSNVWKCQLSLPCPRYNSSFQMYLPRAAFLKSMVFVKSNCWRTQSIWTPLEVRLLTFVYPPSGTTSLSPSAWLPTLNYLNTPSKLTCSTSPSPDHPLLPPLH